MHKNVANDTMDKNKLQDNFYDESGRYDERWEQKRRSKAH